jgi:DnaJ-domain-containing protein 1
MFLEIQIQAAFADGSLHPNERAVLYVIAEELGISRAQFDQFLRMMQGGAQFGGCIVALILEELVPAVQQAVAEQYEAKTGIKETFYVCKPSQGAGQC